MDSTNPFADQGIIQESADAPDLIGDLASLVLPSWLNGEGLTAPEPPEFAPWDSDMPLPDLNDTASSSTACVPPLLEEACAKFNDEYDDSPSLFPWIGDTPEPVDETEHPARDADAVCPALGEDVDSCCKPPCAVITPDAGLLPPQPPIPRSHSEPEAQVKEAPGERDARDELRRDQMKEYATRLWPGASQAPAAPGMVDPHLICTLAGEDFALPLTGVVEVQRLPAVTPVPHTPEWLTGAVNRRGDILSVVDLAGFLGRASAAPSPSSRLVVVKASRDELTIGLIVDQVRGIRGLAPEPLAPSVTLHEVAHARGKFDNAGGVCTILDLDGLLLSARMRRLDLD